jgi:tetratricopeptide (TPR) repeat protein
MEQPLQSSAAAAHPDWSSGALSEGSFTQQVNTAFKNYQSVLALSRLPLANPALIAPALVLDTVAPTADERGHALRLVLQWAVDRLAPEPVIYPLGTFRPYDDPTWRDPRWWRYNILRHRYLEPLHPDEFVAGGRYTETLIALTGIPSPDTFFDERNRAIREVTQWLRQQFLQGEANEIVQRMALEEVVRPLQQQSEAMALLDIAATFDEVFPRGLLLQIATDERLPGVEPALDYLTARRFLLMGDAGTEFWLSPVLQAYLYDRQRSEPRWRRHAHAARHYEAGQDPLRAARHWQQAGEWERAATLLEAAATDLINELQTDELRDALLTFKAGHLPPERWREVQLLLADLCAQLGQRDAALSACRRALKVTTAVQQQARIYRRMGKLYEKHNQLHALGYYEQAAERFDPADPELVDLLKDRGWLYILRSDWARAAADLTRALAGTPEMARERRADIYDALANLHYEQQQYTPAIDHSRRALALREELGNLPRIADSSNNLGLLYSAIGDYAHAISAYEEALVIYRRLDNQDRTATALLNIGMAHHLAGRRETALEFYANSHAICAAIDLRLVQVRACYNMAEAAAELGQDAAARQHWEAGYQLSRMSGFDDEISFLEELRARFPALQAVQVDIKDGVAQTEGSAGERLEPEEQRILELVAQHGQVTPKLLMAVAHISKGTATRRLTRLTEQGYLVKQGKGRSTHYTRTQPGQTSVAEPDSRNASHKDNQLTQLQATLHPHRERLSEQYAIAALGLPDEQPCPKLLRLQVQFTHLPDLPTFFALEGELGRLLGMAVDLQPGEDPLAGQGLL